MIYLARIAFPTEVLRPPPLVQMLWTAHDMGGEHRMPAGLSPIDRPIPGPC